MTPTRTTCWSIALLLAVALPACTKKAPARHAVESKKAAAAPAPTPPVDREALRRRRATWATSGPLAPIMKPCAALTAAASRALLSSAPGAKAFAPFAGQADPKLRSHLQRDKAKKLILMGLEFELVFLQGEKVTLYLRTFLHPGEGGPEFFKIDGRVPKTGKISVDHYPLSAFRGPAEPFAAAARGMATLLAEGRCRKLPIVRPEPLKKIMEPGPQSTRMLTSLRTAKRLRERLCQSLKDFKPAGYHLRLDDLTFAVLGETGKIIGMLKGELKLHKDPKSGLRLELQDYRAMTN